MKSILVEEMQKEDQSYWKKRSNFMYYHYIKYMVQELAYDAKSLIDVGSSNSEYIESFSWIPDRVTLDTVSPYHSENVKGIQADFMKFHPEEKYDFVVCLQVLEHIQDVEPFAKKLFEIGDRVLISVPYMWDEDSSTEHIHDPIDLDKLYKWIGREPDYHIIVQEPLFNSSKNRRLICYYHSSKSFNANTTRKNVSNIQLENKGSGTNLRVVRDMQDLKQEMTELSAKNEQLYTLVIEFLHEYRLEKKINEAQGIITSNKQELKNKKIINSQITSSIEETEQAIEELKLKIKKVQKLKMKIDKEYNEIINSKSWVVTAPIRKLVNKIRSL